MVLRTGASCDQWGLARVVGEEREVLCPHLLPLPSHPWRGNCPSQLANVAPPALDAKTLDLPVGNRVGRAMTYLQLLITHTGGRLIPDRRPLPVAPPWVFTLGSSGICICK